jgi:hypothetical protein
MKRYLALPLVALGMASAPAMASPVAGGSQIGTDHSMIQKVQAFHKDCAWVDNKWTYRRGDKVLVCRPNRPSGSGWIWHREGPRMGWYHSSRKAWHYDKW